MEKRLPAAKGGHPARLPAPQPPQAPRRELRPELFGCSGIDKSTVSRLCKELDEEALSFRGRALEGEVPDVWLDAVYAKVREGGQVGSLAVVLAIGVTAEGTRTALGLDVGNGEDEAFWVAFLRDLVRRGLSGVQLVVSDAHEGLKAAIRKVRLHATWQRCRVHTLRARLARVPKGQQSMALADVLASMAFPSEHWRRIHSTRSSARSSRSAGGRGGWGSSRTAPRRCAS